LTGENSFETITGFYSCFAGKLLEIVPFDFLSFSSISSLSFNS